jgi:hypothetical protein
LISNRKSYNSSSVFQQKTKTESAIFYRGTDALEEQHKLTIARLQNSMVNIQIVLLIITVSVFVLEAFEKQIKQIAELHFFA